jgi:transmembrane sensor
VTRVEDAPDSGGARGELPLPVGRLLVDPVNERHVSRMWRNITAKRAATRGQAGLALRWAFVGVLFGTLVTLASVTLPRGGPVAVEAPAPAGPLRLADGSAFEVVDVAPSTSAFVRLADGSVIRVEPSGRIEPLASSATQFVLRLARGRAVFSVVPGGPRRWLVEAGIATIEVVGTEFSVSRSPDLVRVEVTHGIVLVRGDTLPDGVVRLVAAESVDVRPRETTAPRAPEPETRTPPERAPRGAAAAPRWRSALAGGSYGDAYATLGAAGLAGEAARSESVDDLFDLADVARLSGHPAEAVLPLKRLLSLHAGSSRAPIAALTLGRIELELRQPRDASAHLEQALRLGVPKGLEEDALVRLVQAYSEAGDRAASKRVGEDYERRFPDGRRSAEVRTWLRR